MNEQKVTFKFFVTSLSLQAAIALGRMAHPVSGVVSVNLAQARIIIATLILLKDKTRGNLTAEESSFLERVTAELTVHFDELSRGENRRKE
jgi:hypothetical protein